ncbi:MAG TPA: efflux transporter outer membrane subunit [Candidatus Didemnitutus sp.]|jgi:NodT family efflux transporter outer membrane factor (OMF) lipoprotein
MTASSLLSRGSVLAAIIALAGCAVGPDYRRPAVETPAFKETGDWKPAAPLDDQARGKWWENFNDTTLNGLEERIAVSSNTLRAAEAQYREAEAAAAIVRSSLLPAIDAQASASRNRSPQRSGIAPTTSNAFSVGAQAGWELDLWGRVRRSVEAANAQAEASAADLESVRLSLQSTLAQDYFSIRALDTQAKLYARILADNQRFYQITKNRYDQGVATRADVAAAESQLKGFQAQAIDLTLQRAQLEHAVALLLGEPPASFSLPAAELTVDPSVPPTMVPSDLLQRRPDIGSAERRLAAASADIGVARAGYFPQVTLSGSAGFEGTKLEHLFTTPFEVWSLGASALMPLFDAGKTRAEVRQAQAAFDGATADYRQAVLTAFQEVEDNLAAVRLLADEAKVEDESVAAARESAAIVLNQYKQGIVSYLDVVTAQTTLLNAERTAAQLRARRLNAQVVLFKSVGGNWTDPDGASR